MMVLPVFAKCFRALTRWKAPVASTPVVGPSRIRMLRFLSMWHVDPDADSPTLFSGASCLLESVSDAGVGAFLVTEFEDDLLY